LLLKNFFPIVDTWKYRYRVVDTARQRRTTDVYQTDRASERFIARAAISGCSDVIGGLSCCNKATWPSVSQLCRSAMAAGAAHAHRHLRRSYVRFESIFFLPVHGNFPPPATAGLKLPTTIALPSLAGLSSISYLWLKCFISSCIASGLFRDHP